MKEQRTGLSNRNLRFDGVSEIDPDDLARFLLLGIPPDKIRVTGYTHDVTSFNDESGPTEQIKLVEPETIELPMEWQLPPRYLSLDLESYIAGQFEARCPRDYSIDQRERALDRLAVELNEVALRGMTEFMRTIIFILDEFRRRNIVWGVGRGSSCASYILFILGLHVVDCIKMDVPMEEFYHA